MNSTLKSTRRLLPPALAAAVGLTILCAPTAVQAGYTAYALHHATPESTARYSAVASVSGGKAFADSTIMRNYIQTFSGGVLLASAFANGQPVTMSHQAYAGAQSRCYWDFVGGSIASSIGLNCWRLS